MFILGMIVGVVIGAVIGAGAMYFVLKGGVKDVQGSVK